VSLRSASGIREKMPNATSANNLTRCMKTVQHLLETAPVVRTFDVHTSTAHKVAAEKAA
jgi:hypothetical protein